RRETHHAQGWTWSLYSQNCVQLLRQLLPHLKIKRERALEAIESQQVRRR
ncbi:unnamed protein product, partial [marine sediment metagenome]